MRVLELAALCLVLAVPTVAFACSSTGDAQPSVDAGVDAAEAAAEPVDAGPDIEQPTDIYPAKHADIPQLTNLGGPVFAHPKVVTVTFFHKTADAGAPEGGGGGGDGGDAGASDRTPDEWRNSLRTFDDYIVTSDWWHQTMTGYGVGDGSGHLYGELDDALVAGKSLTDSDIRQMLQAGVDDGSLPAPQAQMIYAVYFPMSAQISDGSGSVACVNFGGYHSETAILVGTGAVDVAYAVLPRCKAGSNTPGEIRDYLTQVASHELAEAASDPFPYSKTGYLLVDNDAWVPSLGLGSVGNENADVCFFAPAYQEGAYQVAAVWSNQAAKESRQPCQPLPIAADPTFFAAAVRTDKTTIATGRGSYASYGYLTVPKGGSVDAVVDVFSTAKLPHDLKLFVGKDKGTGDPTDMAAIPGGIKGTLSRAQARNGNGVVLTLTAPANAVKGTYRFVVRAVLETSDFNDWPVIARVE
jgi:hypothetical protein